MAGVVTENNMANELDQLNLSQQGTLPPELYAQQQQLNRQQQMAAMLMQQNQQPQGQMVSGRYVPTSFFQNLAPVANMLTGAYLAKQGDTKAAELVKQLREGRNTAEEKIIQQMTGTPAQATEMAGPYTNKVPMPVGVQPAVAPNLAGALRDIRTNPYGAGKEYTPSILKQMMPDVPTSMREFEGAQKNPLYQLWLKEQANLKAPRTSIINSMPPAETKYSQVTGELIAKRDDVLRDAAENAQLSIDNIERQRSVLKSNKVITGFGAEPRLALAQFGQAIGAGGKDSNELVSNTQGLLASRAGATLDAIKTSNLGSAQGFSNTDREFLEKAKLGGIKYTAESLNHQLDIEEKLARFSVDKYNNRLKQSPKSASEPLNLKPVTLTSPSNVVDYNSLK
jgi:hypothetical protein